MTDPVTTPTFLETISSFFEWLLAEVGNLITFILGNELLTYMIAIVFVSFIIGVLVRLIRSRA